MSLKLIAGQDFPRGHWMLDSYPLTDCSGYERHAQTDTITNLFSNPTVAVNTTGWNTSYGTGGSSSSESGRVASGGPQNMSYLEMVWQTAATGGTKRMILQHVSDVVPGETYTFSAWVKTSEVVSVGLLLDFYTSTGSFVSLVNNIKTRDVTGWTQLTLTGTVPAGASKIHPMIQLGTNVSAGFRLGATGIILTKTPVAVPYFDGNSTGAEWLGTPNASRSTISVIELTSVKNLAPDPRATKVNTNYSGAANSWTNQRWFGAAPATGTYQAVNNASDGPEGIKSYARKTWTTGTNGVSYGDTGFDLTGYMPVVPGETVNVSWLFRSTSSLSTPYVSFYWVGASRSNVASNVITVQPNSWTRLSASKVAPAGATGVRIAVDAYGIFGVGSTLDATGLIITKGSATDYFDGETPGGRWSGAPNASVSFYHGGSPYYGASLAKGAVRSLIVGSDNKVRYASPVFIQGKEYLPFSVEAFVRPVYNDPSNTAEIQILGHDGQMDGLTIQKGVISFVTKFTNTGEARASFDTMNLQTCHVVGIHTAIKNSLYINGELVSEVDITPEQQADTFIAVGGELSSGATTGPNKFMLNAVALYEGVLDEGSIDEHYAEAQDTLTAEDVAIDYGGQLLEFVSTGAYTPFFRMDYDSDQMWELGGRTNCSLHEGVLYPLTIDGVSVNGWWETVLPLGTAPSAIEAVSILWEGTGAIVKTSRDGILWEVAEKGKPVGTVPVGTLPEGEFLYVRVEFPGDKIDDPSFMDNMSVSVYLSDNPTAFAGREVVMSKAVPENDYDVNDLHQDWGAEMNDGYITIKAAVNNTGAVARTVEVWVQRTGSTFTSSLTSANRIRTNGGPEQPTNLGEWQLRHYVFDADFTGDITFSGTAQIGHIVVYPQSLSDETIAEIYKAYTGKPKVVLDVDEVFNLYEFAGQVDIYEYDWALASAT